METYYYSKSIGGFCPASLYGFKTNQIADGESALPSDAVEISNDDYERLNSGINRDYEIQADENGYPTLVKRAGPTGDEIKSSLTNYRDAKWSSEIVSSASGVRAKTDALTRQRVNEKLNYLESRGEDAVIRWKGPDGFVDATASDFQEITIEAEAVRQRAFDAEDVITGREFKTIEEAKKAFDAAYNKE